MTASVLPIVCAWCERVRTGAGRWEKTEGTGPAASESTHGICPECLAEVQHAAAADAPVTASLSLARARPRP